MHLTPKFIIKIHFNEEKQLWTLNYNPFLVYCRELAPGTVSLTGDRAQGDDSKHDSHYRDSSVLFGNILEGFLYNRFFTVKVGHL